MASRADEFDDATPSAPGAPPGYQDFSSARAYFPLQDWAAASVTGSDREAFLQSFCTNDLRRIEPGGGCEAFLTSVKGKVLAHFVVLACDDQLLLLVGPRQVERMIEHLERYIVREDVSLVNRADATRWLLLSGAAAEAIADRPLGLSTAWAHEAVVWHDSEIRLVRSALTSVESYLAGVPLNGVAAFARRLAGAGAVAASSLAWDALRIEAGWPMWGVDIDDDCLPQEVDRDSWAVSFTKGCYLGQETVARIDALGHVNRRLSTVRFDRSGAPEVGSELTSDGNVAGRISSVCWSPKLSTAIALAMIRRGYNQSGARLSAGDISAEVIATPAVSPAPS